MKELEAMRAESEAAIRAAEGVAAKEAALAQRATALSHLQKMPAELQVEQQAYCFHMAVQPLATPA